MNRSIRHRTKNISIIICVPLASGLLTGEYNKDAKYGEIDNRHFDLGLEAVLELKKVFNTEELVPYALKWILMHDAVSVINTRV